MNRDSNYTPHSHTHVRLKEKLMYFYENMVGANPNVPFGGIVRHVCCGLVFRFMTVALYWWCVISCGVVHFEA